MGRLPEHTSSSPTVAGADKEPGGAAHRPSGLAVGPDGALYISDDSHGRIWRVTFQGDAQTAIAPAPAPQVALAAPLQTIAPPEGIHPDAGSTGTGSLQVPPGATAAQVALGERIFQGTDGGTCEGCHGSNGKGSPLAPDLTSGKWLWGDGSLAAITRTIANGVPAPKQYRSPMPPKGGAQLSDSDVTAVAAYVWALGHQSGH
jgi:mono/diheme cytochrome c family protein